MGGWMYNGAYGSLEEAVRHHLNAAESLTNYDGDHLPVSVRDTLRDDEAMLLEIMSTLDLLLDNQDQMTAEEFKQLMAFLQAQTSPSAIDLSHRVPESVPSGLPVWD